MNASKDEAKPWYRQFWPWFVIAIPLVGVIMGLATLAIAIHEMDEVVTQPHPPLTRGSFAEQARDD